MADVTMIDCAIIPRIGLKFEHFGDSMLPGTDGAVGFQPLMLLRFIFSEHGPGKCLSVI